MLLLTNLNGHYNSNLHTNARKTHGIYTHTINTRTNKFRSGKGSWSSYTKISEHNFHFSTL